jgi:hypothetical protein
LGLLYLLKPLLGLAALLLKGPLDLLVSLVLVLILGGHLGRVDPFEVLT